MHVCVCLGLGIANYNFVINYWYVKSNSQPVFFFAEVEFKIYDLQFELVGEILGNCNRPLLRVYLKLLETFFSQPKYFYMRKELVHLKTDYDDGVCGRRTYTTLCSTRRCGKYAALFPVFPHAIFRCVTSCFAWALLWLSCFYFPLDITGAIWAKSIAKTATSTWFGSPSTPLGRSV